MTDEQMTERQRDIAQGLRTETGALLAQIKAGRKRSRETVREMIAHRPDLLAEYDARMAEIDARHR